MNVDPSVLASLPHGPEFRFIDCVESLEPGHHAAATYHVRGDEAFLRGHFPGHPLLPGVISIEALAQLGGIIAQSAPEADPEAQLRLTAVRNAKILGSALPGETIRIEAQLLARLEGLVQVKGTIAAENGTILLDATVVLATGPPDGGPQPSPETS